jgi:hypothetical protein
MLEGRNDEDISEEVPELVEKITTYINLKKPKEKKFSITAI